MTGSTARRVVLGIRLKQMRERAGLTQQAVASEFNWSANKVIRIEGGRSAVSVTDVAALAVKYGVSDPAVVREMMDWARESRTRDWWTGFHPTSPLYVGLESDARLLKIYNPLVVPGLFQTRDYAGAVVREFMPHLTDVEVEQQVELRMRRQERVGDGLLIQAVIDESVLLRQVGGRDLMRSQCEYLLSASGRAGVDLRVTPLEVGVVSKGQFAIITLGLAEGVELAYTEGVGGDVILATEEAVAQVCSRFERLLASADSKAATRARLSKRINETAARTTVAHKQPHGQ